MSLQLVLVLVNCGDKRVVGGDEDEAPTGYGVDAVGLEIVSRIAGVSFCLLVAGFERAPLKKWVS